MAMTKTQQAHWVTWSAIVAMLAGGFTFFEDLHGGFATIERVEQLSLRVDDCVTNDDLTIALLRRDVHE